MADTASSKNPTMTPAQVQEHPLTGVAEADGVGSGSSQEQQTTTIQAPPMVAPVAPVQVGGGEPMAAPQLPQAGKTSVDREKTGETGAQGAPAMTAPQSGAQPQPSPVVGAGSPGSAPMTPQKPSGNQQQLEAKAKEMIKELDKMGGAGGSRTPKMSVAKGVIAAIAILVVGAGTYVGIKILGVPGSQELRQQAASCSSFDKDKDVCNAQQCCKWSNAQNSCIRDDIAGCMGGGSGGTVCDQASDALCRGKKAGEWTACEDHGTGGIFKTLCELTSPSGTTCKASQTDAYACIGTPAPPNPYKGATFIKSPSCPPAGNEDYTTACSCGPSSDSMENYCFQSQYPASQCGTWNGNGLCGVVRVASNSSCTAANQYKGFMYTCNNQFLADLPNGCQDNPQPVSASTSTELNALFPSCYCGTIQIDVCGLGFVSKESTCSCNQPTRPPVQPSATPPPTPTNTPPPACNSSCTTNSQCPSGLVCSGGFCRNASCTSQANCVCPAPTATPTPQPLVCSVLGVSNTNPTYGQTITLTCQGTPNTDVARAEYQVSINGGTWTALPNATATTSTLSISQVGNYQVRCRVCKDATAASCTAWQGAN